MNSVQVTMVLLQMAILNTRSEYACELYKNVACISESDIAIIFLDRTGTSDNSLLATALLEGIPTTYDTKNPHVQDINGKSIIGGMRELVAKAVTDELPHSFSSLNAKVLTDEIMKHTSIAVNAAINKRSDVLLKKRDAMELEKLNLLEKVVINVLLRTFAETSNLDLVNAIIKRVSGVTNSNIQEILHYPVVQEEIERSIQTNSQHSDESLKAYGIFKTLAPFLLQGMQRDTMESVRNMHHACMEDQLLRHLNDVIVKLVRESLWVASQSVLLIRSEVEDGVFSRSVRTIIKPMLRPVVVSMFKIWEKYTRKELDATNDIPVEDFINRDDVSRGFLKSFRKIHTKRYLSHLSNVFQEEVKNITALDRPLPAIKVNRYLFEKVKREIKEIDICDEIEVYRKTNS